MSKVYHLTLMIEVEDDMASPDNWNWGQILIERVPDIRGFSVVDLETRPFPSMLENPSLYTVH